MKIINGTHLISVSGGNVSQTTINNLIHKAEVHEYCEKFAFRGAAYSWPILTGLGAIIIISGARSEGWADDFFELGGALGCFGVGSALFSAMLAKPIYYGCQAYQN